MPYRREGKLSRPHAEPLGRRVPLGGRGGGVYHSMPCSLACVGGCEAVPSSLLSSLLRTLAACSASVNYGQLRREEYKRWMPRELESGVNGTPSLPPLRFRSRAAAAAVLLLSCTWGLLCFWGKLVVKPSDIAPGCHPTCIVPHPCAASTTSLQIACGSRR
jgi:hypothetical protein